MPFEVNFDKSNLQFGNFGILVKKNVLLFSKSNGGTAVISPDKTSIREVVNYNSFRNRANCTNIEVESGSNDGEYLWRFQIIKFGHWVGIGLFLKEKLEAPAVEGDYNIPGYGFYGISHNGYSWNSASPVQNSLKLSENSVVEVKFSSRSGSLNINGLVLQVPPGRYIPVVLCNQLAEVKILSESLQTNSKAL